MNTTPSHILAVNAGSSSVKFSLYDISLTPLFTGAIERIGMEGTFVSIHDNTTKKSSRRDIIGEPGETLIHILTERGVIDSIVGIGHRVAHGGKDYHMPTLVTPEVLHKLQALTAFAPRHLPVEISLIRKLTALLPDIPQIACFDTSFHHEMPNVAQLIPVPLAYREAGVRRYGFHGLSYEYLLAALRTSFDVPVEEKRIILAHLGSGSSLAAVRNGAPVETTMGLTPNSGIPMSTRTGDVDAGIFEYFTESVGMSPHDFNHMVNYEAGLLAVSGTTGDMEVLLRNAKTDRAAEEAAGFFAYQVRKQIGALAASMGGVDIMVFTGGIGERSPEMRSRVLSELRFLGFELNEAANNEGYGLISEKGAPAAVYCIPANEECVIAQHVAKMVTGSS